MEPAPAFIRPPPTRNERKKNSVKLGNDGFFVSNMAFVSGGVFFLTGLLFDNNNNNSNGNNKNNNNNNNNNNSNNNSNNDSNDDGNKTFTRAADEGGNVRH